MPAPPTVAPPATIRALWPLMIVRTVLAAGTVAATLSVLPGTVERSQRRLVNQQTGQVIEPLPQVADLAAVAGIVGGLVGAAFVVGWLYLGRRAVTGTRWAAVGVAVLSGLGVVSAVSAAVLTAVLEQIPRFSYAYELPGWVLGVSALQAIADAVVVVLLLVPPTRHWFAALDRAAPPPGYGPTTPGRRH